MKRGEKAKKETVEALKKSIRAWNRIRRTALASQDAATAARAMTQCDELTRQLAELKAPANVADLPDEGLSNREIIRRLRRLYHLPEQPVVKPDPHVGMSDAERMVSTAFSLILIGEAGRIDELAAEVERQLLQRRKNEPLRLVGQIAEANEDEIRTARARAGDDGAEPETEAVDDRASGRCASSTGRGPRDAQSGREGLDAEE